MVKRRAEASKTIFQKYRLKKWRGILGALLTFFIVVPYMMGSDVEKYLQHWASALNQANGPFQVEIVNYHRHWFTSEGELYLTNARLPQKVNIQFKAHHGPLLIFNSGQRLHWGLAYFKGFLDNQALLRQQTVIKMDGPIQLTAFIPYFKDRELQLKIPAFTIIDRENKLVYLFNKIEGNLDNDQSLQMELPTLKASYIDGTPLADMKSGLLRILPDNYSAALTFKEIHFLLKENHAISMYNIIFQASIENILKDKFDFNLKLHFDNFKKSASQNAHLITGGPLELAFSVNGLRSEGFIALANTIRTLSKKQDLTPEEGEALEKGISNIFSSNAVFDLNASLSTMNGPIRLQFQGGFTPQTTISLWQNAAELVDAFYSKGNIHITTEVKKALSEYISNHQPETNELLPLSLMLGFLKQDTQGYTVFLNMHNGQIQINGQQLTTHH